MTGITEALRGLFELSLGAFVGGDLQWGRPWGFVFLLLWLFMGAWLFLRRRSQRAALRFSMAHAFGDLPRGRSVFWQRLADALLWGSAFILVLSLVRPQVLGEPNPRYSEGIDIVVALDVSGSMRAADFRPKDRLTVAKMTIAKHVLERQNDRIGLVVFAGEAYSQSPLTHDKALLREFLGGVQTGVLTDGTAIGDAVARSTNRLRDSKSKSRVIILLTDGDNNSGVVSPEKAAELAAEFDIQIYPILVGRGGRVPFPMDGNNSLGEPRYQEVEIPINPALLKKMAKETGGAFFRATQPQALEGALQDILSELDKSQLESGPISRKVLDLYPALAIFAFLIFCLAMLLRATKAQVVP